MEMFFGLGVGNSILAPIGFMGPGTDLAGWCAGGLAVGSFIILGIVYQVDRRTRADFLRMLATARLAAPGDIALQQDIDGLEGDVMSMRALVEIGHDIGFLYGKLVEKGYLDESQIDPPVMDL